MLKWASKNGYLEIIKLLFEKGVDLSIQDNCAFKDAIYHNNVELTKWLLENGVDVNYNDSWAIRSASCNNNRLELIKLLISKGINIQAGNNMALKNACVYGRLEVVRILLENGASVISTNNDCALKEASYQGRLEIVKLLLAYGAKFNEDIDERQVHSIILELFKEYKNPKCFGIESTIKLDIKLPGLEEICKNDIYYYVYKYQKDNNGWIIPNWTQKHQLLTALNYGTPKHFQL